MPANPTFDGELLSSQRCGQCVRKRRCTTNMAKREFYKRHRTARLAKLGN